VNLLPRERVMEREGSVTVATQDGRVNRARADGMMRVGKDGTLSLSASGAYSPGRTANIHVDGEGTQRVSRIEQFQGATSVGRLSVGDFTAQYFVTYRDQTVPIGAWGTLVGDTNTFVRDTRALLELRYEPKLTEKLTLKTRAFGNFYDYLGEYSYDEPNPDPDNESLARERIRGAWAGLEARAVYEQAGRYRVTVGAEGQFHPLADMEGEFVGSTGDTSSYMEESQTYVLGAAYGLVEWRASERFRLSAGARLDYWSTFGFSVNPRLALVVKPTANDTFKLMGGRAFRAPSAYETLYNDGGVTQLRADWAGARLNAESVYSGELEYVRRIGRDFRILATVHGQLLDDLVETLVATTEPDEPIYYANGGTRAFTVGGDVEIQRELRAGILMMAQYGYLEARYIEGGPSGQSGRLPNVPKHFASARGIIPLGKSGASLGARTTLEGKRLVSSESGEETRLAVLTDVVVSGVVRAAHLRYSFGVYDLFDARGSVPVQPGFASTTMPRTGRTILVLLGLTY
jgi:outer membrane receptor for ferrienterochelin and colicins